jgi:hypothetical protein
MVRVEMVVAGALALLPPYFVFLRDLLIHAFLSPPVTHDDPQAATLSEDLRLSARELDDIRSITDAAEFQTLCHRLVRTNCGFDALDLALCIALACVHAAATAWASGAASPPAGLALDWTVLPRRECCESRRVRARLGTELDMTEAETSAWAQLELHCGAAALRLLLGVSAAVLPSADADAAEDSLAGGHTARPAYSPTVRDEGSAAIVAYMDALLHDLNLMSKAG